MVPDDENREKLLAQIKFVRRVGNVAFVAAIVLGFAAWIFWDDASTYQTICDAYNSLKSCAREETQRERAVYLLVGTAISGAVAVGCTVKVTEANKRLRLLGEDLG